VTSNDGDLLALLDELQSIARTGLNFTKDPYVRAHYERLLELSTVYYGRALDLPPQEVRARLRAEVGCLTPKVGADAAIFDDEGRILLVLRADDQCWGLPAGWLEPNEAPRDAAVREAREEIGLDIEPLQLLDVSFRPARADLGPHAVVSVIFLCAIRGGTIRLSHEVLDARYWPIGEVRPWHKDHERFARAAHRVWQERRHTM
jgi:ADP-ribose pyrophosphatase YjhB (NUDIX family)